MRHDSVLLAVGLLSGVACGTQGLTVLSRWKPRHEVAEYLNFNCPGSPVMFQGDWVAAANSMAIFDIAQPDACLSSPAENEMIILLVAYPQQDIYSINTAGVDASIVGDKYNPPEDMWRVIDLFNGDTTASIGIVDQSGGRQSARSGSAHPLIIGWWGSLFAVTPDKTTVEAFDAAIRLVPYVNLMSHVTPPKMRVGDALKEEVYLAEVISSLQIRKDVATVLDTVSAESILADIRYLSGEDRESPIRTRHSFSSGALDAANWLLSALEQTDGDCHLWNWRDGFAPNVVCTYMAHGAAAADAPVAVLGARYDNRGGSNSTLAPGANAASGVAHVLAIAKAIHDNKILLSAPLHIVAFSGAEQGLLGSAAYASRLAERNVSVAFMIQADMLAYHKRGEPMQLGLTPERDYRNEPVLNHLIGRVATLYAPELRIGPTMVCCSDAQSFLASGFVATGLFERSGLIADPMYHTSGDVAARDGFDVAQVRSIAKVTLATLLHALGFAESD